MTLADLKQIPDMHFSQLANLPQEYIIGAFWVGAAASFIFGACWGSFLNVCIWRLPREESVFWPPSACPHCARKIRFWENIPILSWLCLRGKCRGCAEPISPRYVYVELLTGMLFTGIWAKLVVLDESLVFLFPPFVMTMLIVCTCFIDAEHQIIPDETTYPSMGMGLVFALLLPGYWGVESRWLSLSFSCASLAGAAGALALFALLGRFIFKQEALGWGDVKYLGAVGALLGPAACFFTVFAGALAGSIGGLGLMIFGKAKVGTPIPFGPYLAVATYIWIIFGTWLLKKYLMLAAFFHGAKF